MSAISYVESCKQFLEWYERETLESLERLKTAHWPADVKKRWEAEIARDFYIVKLERELFLAYLTLAADDPLDLAAIEKHVVWVVEEMNSKPDFLRRVYELHAFDVMALAKESTTRDTDWVEVTDPKRYYESLLWRFNNRNEKLCLKKKARKAR